MFLNWKISVLAPTANSWGECVYLFPPTPAAATNGDTNRALSMGAAADVEAVLIASRHRATGRERANEGRIDREPGGPVRPLRVGLGVCEGAVEQ